MSVEDSPQQKKIKAQIGYKTPTEKAKEKASGGGGEAKVTIEVPQQAGMVLEYSVDKSKVHWVNPETGAHTGWISTSTGKGTTVPPVEGRTREGKPTEEASYIVTTPEGQEIQVSAGVGKKLLAEPIKKDVLYGGEPDYIQKGYEMRTGKRLSTLPGVETTTVDIEKLPVEHRPGYDPEARRVSGAMIAPVTESPEGLIATPEEYALYLERLESPIRAGFFQPIEAGIEDLRVQIQDTTIPLATYPLGILSAGVGFGRAITDPVGVAKGAVGLGQEFVSFVKATPGTATFGPGEAFKTHLETKGIGFVAGEFTGYALIGKGIGKGIGKIKSKFFTKPVTTEIIYSKTARVLGKDMFLARAQTQVITKGGKYAWTTKISGKLLGKIDDVSTKTIGEHGIQTRAFKKGLLGTRQIGKIDTKAVSYDITKSFGEDWITRGKYAFDKKIIYEYAGKTTKVIDPQALGGFKLKTEYMLGRGKVLTGMSTTVSEKILAVDTGFTTEWWTTKGIGRGGKYIPTKDVFKVPDTKPYTPSYGKILDIFEGPGTKVITEPPKTAVYISPTQAIAESIAKQHKASILASNAAAAASLSATTTKLAAISSVAAIRQDYTIRQQIFQDYTQKTKFKSYLGTNIYEAQRQKALQKVTSGITPVTGVKGLTATGVISKTGITPIQRPAITTAVMQKQAVKLKILPITTTITTTRVTTPLPPPPIIPPPTIILPPISTKRQFPVPIVKAKKKKLKKRVFKYRPGFTAVTLGIKEYKPPEVVTGIQPRPIIIKRKKRKKK